MLRFPLRQLSRESNRRPSAEARRRGRRIAAGLETMEGRVLLNAGPTTFNVTNTSGSASVPGSLPAEIALANANTNRLGSVIQFRLAGIAPYTITLDQPLTLTETSGPEMINGSYYGGLVISGNHKVEVIWVAQNVSARLNDLFIENGMAAEGGGIGNQGQLSSPVVRSRTIQSPRTATGAASKTSIPAP